MWFDWYSYDSSIQNEYYLLHTGAVLAENSVDSLVNLTEDKSIVSEYIQRFPYSEIANELRSLIEDTEMRKAQISQLREMGERYFGGASMSVARELFSSLNK